MAQCEYRKQDGARCKAYAMNGCKFCFSHNPDAGEQKRAAVKKGGKNRRIPRRASTPKTRCAVRSVADLQTLAYQAVEDLRQGEIDIDVARALGYLIGVATKVSESVEFAKRIEQLEEKAVIVISRMGDERYR